MKLGRIQFWCMTWQQLTPNQRRDVLAVMSRDKAEPAARRKLARRKVREMESAK